VCEPRMTPHAKMLGHGADGEQASVVLESLMMAQVALVLARLGVPDLIAAGPRPVASLAAEAGAVGHRGRSTTGRNYERIEGHGLQRVGRRGA
jgi:hypothetical protein